MHISANGFPEFLVALPEKDIPTLCQRRTRERKNQSCKNLCCLQNSGSELDSEQVSSLNFGQGVSALHEMWMGITAYRYHATRNAGSRQRPPSQWNAKVCPLLPRANQQPGFPRFLSGAMSGPCETEHLREWSPPAQAQAQAPARTGAPNPGLVGRTIPTDPRDETS